MKTPGPGLVAAVAVVVALAIVLPLLLLGGHGTPLSPTATFDFSQNLPTGTIESNGQLDCGSNVTASLTVPAHTTVYYELQMNTSGGSANVWTVGTDLRGFQAVGQGGPSYSELGYAAGGTLEFFLQGCGPTPTVALGLWGHYNSSVLV